VQKRTFNKKVIVITGASGNLGRAIALQFAQAGSQLVALDYNQTALAQMQIDFEQKGHSIATLVCDITDEKACEATIQQVINKYQRIDGLVNNAGITHIERFMQMSTPVATTRRVMAVNFFGAVYCTYAALPQLRKNKGFIVAISSVAGFAPLLGRTAYAASKHALHGFFESLGAELQEEGLHCLMVCPSFISPPKKDTADAKDSIYQDKKTIGATVSAQSIARDILMACQRNKKTLVCGRTGKISYLLRRFFPRLYEYFMINKLKNDI